MSNWLYEAEHMLFVLMGSFDSTTTHYVVLGVALLVMLFTLIKVAGASGATMASLPRALAVVVLGFALTLGAAIATKLYLLPQVPANEVTRWLPVVAAVVTLLVIVTPLCSRITISGYFEAIFALALSLVAAALVVVLAHAGMQAFKSGDEGFMKTRERTERIDNLIDGDQ